MSGKRRHGRSPSTTGVETPVFIGNLLLLVDPCAIKRGLQLRNAGLAQRRADVFAQDVMEVREFQDAGRRMLERGRDHASSMVAHARMLAHTLIGGKEATQKPVN
jgi:hypothetical protein